MNTTSAILAALLVVALVAGSFAGEEAAPVAPTRVGVINLEAVVSRSAAGKALRQRLSDFQVAVQKEGGELNAKVQDLRKKLSSTALPDEDRKKVQRDYETATILLRRFRGDKQREGQKLQSTGLRKIETSLGPVVKAVFKARGLDVLVNNVAGVVVQSAPGVDVTEEVIRRFDAARK